MLGATVHKRGDATIVRCQGRFVTGADYTILRKAVLDHTHAGALILDMAQVERVDAGGLGVLLRVRERARSKTVRLKLLNLTSRVREVFELTRLDRAFEICSAMDMFLLPQPRASAGTPSSEGELGLPDAVDTHNRSAKQHEAPLL
jgi:anti-anti-sigma factor